MRRSCFSNNNTLLKKEKATKFKERLGFNQRDFIMKKEQSVLTKKTFSCEKILEHHYVLKTYINLYFPEHKLAIEVDEIGHKDRDEHKENKRQKVIERELVFKFIRINPDEEHFDTEVN